MPLGKVSKTSRGFENIEFLDRYNIPCSLQASSLAEYCQPGTSAVWFGPNDANPQILASQAAAFGVKTDQTTGWVKYPIPDEVLCTTRAHLDRKRVKALIKHLQAWLDTGSFKTRRKSK